MKAFARGDKDDETTNACRARACGAGFALTGGCSDDGDGGGGANVTPGPVFDLGAEPAGENCEFGGQRLTGGLDKNGNGRLDADEVTSTSYACRAEEDAERAPKLFYGTYTATNEAELADLNRYDGVVGHVSVAFSARPTQIGMRSNRPKRVQLDLAYVLGELEIALHEETEEVVLPNLVSVGYVNISAPGLTTLSLPKLENVDHMGIESNARLSTLSLPRLTNARRLSVGGTSLAKLELPALHTVANDLDILNNPLLQTVSLPALRTAGDFFVFRNERLGSLTLESLAQASSVEVYENAALASLSFPVFAVATYFEVDGHPELEAIDVPKLKRLAGLALTDNPKLSRCIVNAITAGAMGASVTAGGNFDDPETCTTLPKSCENIRNAAGEETRFFTCRTAVRYANAHDICSGRDGKVASFKDVDDFKRFRQDYERQLMGEFWVGYDRLGGEFAWNGDSTWKPAHGEFLTAQGNPWDNCVVVGDASGLSIAQLAQCGDDRRVLCEPDTSIGD